VVSFYRPRQTELARRRRLIKLVRELADDLGYDRVTLAEWTALKQSASTMQNQPIPGARQRSFLSPSHRFAAIENLD
jgi:hypothetical protein